MKPAIKAMQEWLKSCPLVAGQLGGNVAFHIDYLPEDTTQFSIEDAPGDPVLASFFSGKRKAKNYVLASRMEYSESIAQQADTARRVQWTKQAGRVWRSRPNFQAGAVPRRKFGQRQERHRLNFFSL